MEVLTDKSYKSYERLSRYSSFPYYYNRNDNKYIYGTTGQLDDTTPSSSYIVKQNDTYDSIALDFYNNPTYYWVICDFNRIQDPFENPAEGTLLRIPVFSSIRYV